MPDTTSKPVIFLAFANDRDDTVSYLRNLPDEARRLRDVLESAEQAGLCEVVVRSNSTASDIFKVFQDPKYRNRIAVFHYGGHADGYQLLLESPEGKAAAADAGGLAAFLAQQQGLQLVFLNGCSTQQQTQELHDANVSVVISTSRSIDDKVATDFADLFYQGLAGGATLRKAYHEASAAIKITKGGDLRALYFGDADKPEDHRNGSGFPWNLYPREGSENADQWNLPEAAGDVLFGLPPLKEEKLPESPYRYLSYFRRKDAEVFFGRGHQIRKLYGLLTAGTQPIILFYGQSGVGKSSLLDAGLMPRLEQSCEVRYLRRRAGGLLDTLQLAFLPEASNVPIETAWLAKEEQLKKPLIVFLDQVEEFYPQPIEDLPDELDQLLRVVKATFSDPKCRPKGKLVLGFRKEWLAEIETQMIAYELDRAKVSLEPLDRDGIIEVVQGPTRSARLRERYGLQVEKGLAEIIADDMLKDRGSAISTTLQILLSKMWTEAIAANSESPKFSQELYQALERNGILLRDFFNQQLEEFKSRLPRAADSGLLLDVLALHTTDLGSANECSEERLLAQYAHVSDELPSLIRQSQDLYLLTEMASTQKESTKTTRLAHDTLAPLVRDKFDKSDKPGQRARRILDNRSVDWESGCKGTPLDEADLNLVGQGAGGTRSLTPTERRLLEASYVVRDRLERNRKILKIAGTVAAVVIVIASIVAIWKSVEADKERNDAIAARKDADTRREEAERQERIAVFERKASLRNLSASLAAQSAAVKNSLPQRSVLLAAQAVNVWRENGLRPVVAAEQSLRGSLQSLGGIGLCGHEDAVTVVAISPDNHWLVTGSSEQARLWDLTAKEPENTVRILDGHDGAIKAVAISNRWLVTGSSDSTACLCDLAAAQPEKTTCVLRGHKDDKFLMMEASPDHNWIVTGGLDHTVRLWDLTTESPGKLPRVLHGHEGPVVAAAFSSDNRWLITGSEDSTARLWDLTAEEPENAVRVLRGHESWVQFVAISADNRSLVTGSKKARIWDLTAEEPEKTPCVVSFPISRYTTISRDNRWLVTDRLVCDLRSKDPEKTIQVLAQHERHEDEEMMDFSPRRVYSEISSDSRLLVTYGGDNIVRLWDLTAPDLETTVRLLPGHDSWVEDVAISANSRWLATGSLDNTGRIWDLATEVPEKTARVLHHGDYVYAVAFSGDNHWLVTGTLGNAARIWDLTAEEPEKTSRVLRGHTDAVTGVAVCGDNRWLVAQTRDHSVQAWPLQLETLLSQAARAVGRNFTREEWEEIFPNDEFTTPSPFGEFD